MRIALVDDHPVLRSGLRWLLEKDGHPIAEVGDAHAAVRLACSSEVDVFVVDVGLPGPDGFAAARELVRVHPGARILMLSMHGREEMVVRALRAGATGYALKDQPITEIAEAIGTVGQGRRYIAPRLCTARLDELLATGRGADGPLSLLSPREREVFDLHVRGLSNKEAARQLFVTVKTVETHRTHIYRKLGVHSIVELMRLAAAEGAILPQ